MFGYSLIFNEQDCQKIELHYYAGTYNLIAEKIIRLIVAISYSKMLYSSLMQGTSYNLYGARKQITGALMSSANSIKLA